MHAVRIFSHQPGKEGNNTDCQHRPELGSKQHDRSVINDMYLQMVLVPNNVLICL